MLRRLCRARGAHVVCARTMPRSPLRHGAVPGTLRSHSSSAVSDPPRLVDELERLETKLPWWQTSMLRLTGTFSDAQWQAAAGGDVYMHVLRQSDQDEVLQRGNLPERLYTQLQVRGLHCWLAHVRLRTEPKARVENLFYSLMEHVWEQAQLDMSRQMGMGYIEISKHLKAAQTAWHGSCKALDEALETEPPQDAVAAVLLRNLYVDEEGEPLVDNDGQPTAGKRSRRECNRRMCCVPDFLECPAYCDRCADGFTMACGLPRRAARPPRCVAVGRCAEGPPIMGATTECRLSGKA